MKTILRLPATHLQAIVSLVKENDPDYLEKKDSEYSFDLNQLNNRTLDKINQHVNNAKVGKKRPVIVEKSENEKRKKRKTQ